MLKVTDFGFARDVGIGDSLSETFCGSTVYAAPEILTATEWYDPRWADTWSCGVVLFAMLTAKMPFAREQLAKFVKFQYVDGKSEILDLYLTKFFKLHSYRHTFRTWQFQWFREYYYLTPTRGSN